MMGRWASWRLARARYHAHHAKVCSFSPTERSLTTSLAVYVSGDDVGLTREQFLRTVISRIEDDLKYGTMGPS